MDCNKNNFLNPLYNVGAELFLDTSSVLYRSQVLRFHLLQESCLLHPP